MDRVARSRRTRRPDDAQTPPAAETERSRTAESDREGSDCDRLLSEADQRASDRDQALADGRAERAAGAVESEREQRISRAQRAETSAARARTAALRAQNARLRTAVAGPPADHLLPLLTRREREVLGLLADGLRNDGVAWRLSISTLTVRSHVKNIMRKLEADTRTEAVAKALRRSLIA